MKQLKSNSPEITIDIDTKVVVSYKQLIIRQFAKYICRFARFWEDWRDGLCFFIGIFGTLGCIISLVGEFGIVINSTITTFSMIKQGLVGGFVGAILAILVPYIIWEIIQISRWVKNWAEINKS